MRRILNNHLVQTLPFLIHFGLLENNTKCKISLYIKQMIENLIVIPYRNRKTHIEYYLKDTLPLLQKHLPSFHVVIVEQDDTSQLFNRGKLINVAALEYKDKAKYLITQDVDVNPNDSAIHNLYLKQLDIKQIYSIFSAHSSSLGGIVKIPMESFHAMNGFPNYIWGWGIEDRVLFYRS
jgi:hypothetical protein